jgi:hypothetical protein
MVSARGVLVVCTAAAITTACSHDSSTRSLPRRSIPPLAQMSASAAGVAIRNGPPRLIVTPAHGLHGREVVVVTLHGFRPGEKVWLSECAPNQAASPDTGCGDQVAAEAFTITDAAGARDTARFRVSARPGGHPCRPHCSVAAVGNAELAVDNIYFS